MGFEDDQTKDEILETQEADKSSIDYQEGTRALNVGITPHNLDDLMPLIGKDIESAVAQIALKQNDIAELINGLGVRIVGDEKYLTKYKKFERK